MPDPVEFPEQNIVFAKDQPQYRPLPAHKVPNDPLGRVITAWAFSDAEMQTAHEGAAIYRETGCVIWHQVLTFNQPYPPMALLAEKPYVESPNVADVAKVIDPPYTAQEYELAIQEMEARFTDPDRLAVLRALRERLHTNRNPRPL